MIALLPLALGIAAAVAVWVIAKRRDWPPAPTLCLVFGIILLLYGAWFFLSLTTLLTPTPVQTDMEPSSTYYGTYQVDAWGQAAISLGLMHLILGAAAFWIARIGNRWTRRVTDGAVLALCVATGVSLTFRVWLVSVIFGGQVYAPISVFWINQLHSLFAFLSFLSVATILLCLVIVLSQKLMRRNR